MTYLAQEICILNLGRNISLNRSWKRGCLKMFGFLIILLSIGAYFYCKQNGCHPHKMVSSDQDALDIVRARYARGEISSEDFNERKKSLE